MPCSLAQMRLMLHTQVELRLLSAAVKLALWRPNQLQCEAGPVSARTPHPARVLMLNHSPDAPYELYAVKCLP